MTSAFDPAAEFDYTYDPLGRRTSVVHDLAGLSFNVELMSVFDAANNRTDLKALFGGTAAFWNEYAHDDLHRMTSVEQHGAGGGSAVAEKRIDFTYDAAGHWDTITRYADISAIDVVATSIYTHDDAGRLIALTHAKGANTLADYDWTYDAANRITAFTNNVHTAESATYSYDDTNQLMGADRSGTSNDESYTYDANGNRTNTGYTTGDNNQLTSDGTYNYTYDDEGNRLTRTHIASGVVDEYEWDHRNRLIGVTTRSSSTGPATQIVSFVYDLWNRRVAKLVDSNADSTWDTQTHYILDGERHERGHAGDHIVLTFDANEDLTHRYLYGPAVDQILADEAVTTTSTAGDVLWPLGDNLNTIRDLAEYNSTNDTTTVANHRTIDSFGNITSETNAAVDHLFAYTARELDEEVGLYYYRERIYDAITGRFLSEDPIYDDYNNPYRYVGNSPGNATDPSGLRDPDPEQNAYLPPWLTQLKNTAAYPIGWTYVFRLITPGLLLRGNKGKTLYWRFFNSVPQSYYRIFVTDSPGRTCAERMFSGTMRYELLQHLLKIERIPNGKIRWLIIKGHGDDELKFISDNDNEMLIMVHRNRIYVNDRNGDPVDITDRLRELTGEFSHISIRGCNSDALAKALEKILNNGTTVSGYGHSPIGIPFTDACVGWPTTFGK